MTGVKKQVPVTKVAGKNKFEIPGLVESCT